MSIINNQQPQPFARLTSNTQANPITSVPDPVAQANLWAREQAATPYVGDKTNVFYLWDEGNVAMGVAGPNGTPAEVVKLRAAKGWKAVAFFRRRENAEPGIPPREPNTANQVFMGEGFGIDSVDLAADGQTKIYTRAGWRLYLLRTPLSPDNGDTLKGYPAPAVEGADDQDDTAITPADLDPTQLPG